MFDYDIYSLKRALAVGWGLWRGISMTPRKLQQTTSRVAVLFSSTLVSLTKVESESRQFRTWFSTSVLRLRTELNGSRRSFLCVTLNRYTQNCAQVPYQFQRTQIRRDVCCLILNAALQVHFLTEYRIKKNPATRV